MSMDRAAAGGNLPTGGQAMACLKLSNLQSSWRQFAASRCLFYNKLACKARQRLFRSAKIPLPKAILDEFLHVTENGVNSNGSFLHPAFA